MMRSFTIKDEINPRFVITVRERDVGCPGDRLYVQIEQGKNTVYLEESELCKILDRIEKEESDAG